MLKLLRYLYKKLISGTGIVSKILICEDDKEIMEMLDMVLSFEGFELTFATTGIECKNILSKEKFDLILLDLRLPDIDGEYLCKHICTSYGTPVIIVSAKDNVSTKVLCFEYGAEDYIVKPFDTMELIARIKRILKRKTGEEKKKDNEKEIIQWQGLEVNKTERTVFKEGKEIALTPREYDLLLFFIENKGKTFEREEIIEKIWGKQSLYKWSRALDVHINHLRKKIEKNPSKPDLIQTVPGVGYRAKP